MYLYLLRHAETEGNAAGVNTGQTNALLSNVGKQMAEELVSVLSAHTYDLIIRSPLTRTLQTLEPYLGAVGKEAPPIVIDERTIERGIGIFSNTPKGNKALQQHREEYFNGDRIAWRPPEGESIYDVMERAQEVLAWLCREHAQKTILICGHQNFLRCFELLVLGWPADEFYRVDPPRLKNGELREYAYMCVE